MEKLSYSKGGSSGPKRILGRKGRVFGNEPRRLEESQLMDEASKRSFVSFFFFFSLSRISDHGGYFCNVAPYCCGCLDPSIGPSTRLDFFLLPLSSSICDCVVVRFVLWRTSISWQSHVPPVTIRIELRTKTDSSTMFSFRSRLCILKTSKLVH